MRISELLDKLREELPDIQENDEDSWTWCDEGIEFLETSDFFMAERKFQELILAQPRHYDGYEGLALVYRELGRLEEAALLIDHARKLAEGLLAKDHIDQHVLDEIVAEHTEITGAYTRQLAQGGSSPDL